MSGGYKRMRVDISKEFEIMWSNRFGLCYDICAYTLLRCGKSAVDAAFCAQTLDIHLPHHHLLFEREAFRLGYNYTVLVYQGIAAIDHILCALAETTAAIDISRHGTSTLLGKK